MKTRDTLATNISIEEIRRMGRVSKHQLHES